MSEFWKFSLCLIGFPMLCGLAGIVSYTVYVKWSDWLARSRRTSITEGEGK